MFCFQNNKHFGIQMSTEVKHIQYTRRLLTLLHLECFPIFERDFTLDTLARWCLIPIVHGGVLIP